MCMSHFGLRQRRNRERYFRGVVEVFRQMRLHGRVLVFCNQGKHRIVPSSERRHGRREEVGIVGGAARDAQALVESVRRPGCPWRKSRW